MKFASLWKGPDLHDTVEYAGCGCAISHTWQSYGLYGLDADGRPWTLCAHSSRFTGGPGVASRWFLVDDLISGAAAKQWQNEERS